MADRDPFSALGDPWGEQPKAPGMPKSPAGGNPFAELGDPWGEQAAPTASDEPQSTAWGAARRAAGRSLLPSIGGFAGFGAGMEAGAIAGSLAGPAGTFIGGLAGGLVGSIGASWATSKVQDAALEQLPGTWQDALGQSKSQQRADEEKHPYASFLGGALPYLVTMRPGAAEPFLKSLPENATGLQRLLANPTTSRLFGGGLMGGMELGQEYAQGDVDWRKVAISTGMGLVLNKQNAIGDAIMGPSAAAGRAVMPKSWAARYDAMRGPPTVAQAADEKTAGAGVTEEVFHGTEQMDPAAERVAQNAARTEAVATGSSDIVPDPHDIARRMDPELFARADALDAQIGAFRREIEQFHNPPESAFAEAEARAQKLQDELTAHLESQNGYTGGKEARRLRAELRGAEAELTELKERQVRYSAGGAEETPELATIRQHLVAAQQERWDLGRDLAASYRRAEEALGGGRSVFPAETTGPERGGRPLTLPELVAQTDGSQRPAGVSGAPESAAAPPVTAQPASKSANAPSVSAPAPSADRQQIVADMTARLRKKGMSEAEAAANAEVWASYYETRAARFGGKRGSSVDLYRNKSPLIAGAPGPFEIGRPAAESRVAPAAPVEPTIEGQPASAYHGADQVRDLLRNGASVETIANHPYVKAANARLQSIPTTDKLPGYGTPEFEQNRVLTVDGQRHVGYDAGTDALVRKAESYSTSGPVANNKQATIVIGPPASGKSSISERIAERTHSAIADVDDAKAALPEFHGGIGANATHEESGELGSIVLGKLMDKGANVIIPKVRHSKDGISKLIDRMKGEGYDVHLVNIDVTPENAFTRMIGRFLSTGRLINPDYFASIGDKPLQTYNALKTDERLTSHANVESNGPPGTQTVSEGAEFAADAARGGRGREISGAIPETPPKTGPASGAEPREPVPAITETSGNVSGAFAEPWQPPYSAEVVAREHVAAIDRAIDISRKLSAMTPEQQMRDVPKFNPDAKLPAGEDIHGPFMFNATALNVDADRFQFKSGGDEYGVTGAQRSVNKWDKSKADQIIVWQDKDGKLWVADGHQRSGLARRLVAEGKADKIEIAGTLLREADGVTAADARAIAAVKNIAAGTGTALDGAKVLRARPDMIGELNGLSAGKAGQAISLAKLDDEAWRMVINRVVPEHQAAIVGEMIPEDGPRQIAAMKAIAQHEPRNEEEVRVLLSRVRQAELVKGEAGRQASMFDDFELPESTVGEEMKIVGKAIKGLEKDRGLFKRVVANAQRIEETGSRIERDTAKAVVDDAGVFAKQLASDAYAKGPVRDALVDAARELKNGDIKIGEAVERVLSALRRQAEENGPHGAGAPSGRTVGEGGAGGEAGAEGERTFFQEAKDLETEPGAEGLPQTLIPGVEPVKQKSQADLLRERAAAPLKGGNAAMPDTGLFGERRQGELFQRRMTPNDYRRILEAQRATEGMRAAVRDPETGKIYTGWSHQAAIDSVPQSDATGAWGRLSGEWDRSTDNTGFIDKQGNFVSRSDAEKSFGVSTMEDLRDLRSFRQSAAGKIRIAPGKRSLITLAQKADASTFMHESGHQFLEDLMADALHEHAPPQLKDDADTVLSWLGVKSAEDIKVRHHEKFARGFEQYLREGVAPSEGLAHVFQQFKSWLTAIYRTLKGLGTPINEDIRGVFDRMLAENPERTVLAEGPEKPATLPEQHEAAVATVHPADADPYADKVKAETESALASAHPEVANEAQAAYDRTAAAGRADQPAGEAGAGNRESAALERGSKGPDDQSGGGASGAGAKPELRGGGAAAAEGAGLRGGTDGGPGAGDGLGNAPFAPRPAERFGARESPFVDKAGNIRVENLTTSRDVTQAIHDAADANNDYIADRRGVVTDGQVMDLADDLGMKYTDLLQRKIGQAFNAEQVIAARKLLVQSATEVVAAMKKAASGTDADVMAYAQVRDRHQMIQGQIAGITAEAGRALRAFRDISMAADAAAADAMVRQATGRTLYQLRMEAQLGMALETPQQVSAFMRAAEKHSFPRMVLEYWINGLISGPATHVTYMVGNNILSLWKTIPETAAAAAIGAVRKSMGREGEAVQFGEVGAGLKAKWQSRPSAIQAAIESFRTGQNALLPGEKMHQSQGFGPDYEFASRWEIEPNAKYSDVMASAFGAMRGVRDGFTSAAGLLKAGGVEGAPLLGWNYSNQGAIPNFAVKGVTVLPTGDIARLPSRFVAAIHSYFKAMNYSIDIASQSFRTAAGEGLEGQAFDARVANLRQNPTPEMMQGSVNEALNLTLMGTGGEFTKRLSALTNYETASGFKPLKFIDPFVHISSNIISEAMLKRSPVGLLSAEIRKDLSGANGNIAQDKAMARMLVGTATAVGAGLLAAEGYLSGSGPSDRNEAAMWRLAGNQAHSVRIGDVWYDIHKLGPLGLLMSTAADMFEISHIVSEGELTEAAAHLHHAFIHNILDKSFMRGPADLIKAIEDPQRFGQSYVNNFLSSFIPFSVGQAQIARAMDPYSRQARTFMDSLKAKVPGLSEDVLPRRDIWGEPIQARQVLGIPGASAIWAQEVSKDPVNLALLDLGIGIAPVQKKIRNVELTPEQLDDFQRLAGRTAKMRLDTIVNSAQWQQWPDHIREQVVKEAVKQAREVARGTMMMKYPQIMRDAVAAKREAMSGGQPPVSSRGM